MIIRTAFARHGRRVVASPITRSYGRFLSTETTTNPGLTPEQFEALTTAAELNHVAYTSELLSKSDSQVTPELNARTPPIPKQQIPAHIAYNDFRRLEKATSNLGSRVERRYVPDELISNPPGPKDVTLELLMASQTHMGHHTSLWNPANARYIYGVRQGIHIISLETTASHLRRAARVVEEVAYRGGLILFVGTRRGQMEIVTRASQLSQSCHLFTKWTPGGITNRDIILSDKMIRIVNEKDEDVPDFDAHIRDRRPLVPDLVVCMNPLENYVLLYECGLAGIPTIGVIDTDADPSWVTYTIPANDDSLRSIAVISGVLGRAGEIGQKRRLEDAESGVVPWEIPTETKRFMAEVLKQEERDLEKWRSDSSETVNGNNAKGRRSGKSESSEATGEEMLLKMLEEGRRSKGQLNPAE